MKPLRKVPYIPKVQKMRFTLSLREKFETHSDIINIVSHIEKGS